MKLFFLPRKWASVLRLSTRYSALGTIVIHPGSGGYSLARRWDAAQFAALADALHQQYDAQIVLVGGINDCAQV